MLKLYEKKNIIFKRRCCNLYTLISGEIEFCINGYLFHYSLLPQTLKHKREFLVRRTKIFEFQDKLQDNMINGNLMDSLGSEIKDVLLELVEKKRV